MMRSSPMTDARMRLIRAFAGSSAPSLITGQTLLSMTVLPGCGESSAMPAVAGRRLTASGRRILEHGEVVRPADAAAEPGDVRAIDVDRDRDALTAVAHLVNVTGRRESTDLTDVVLAAADLGQVLPVARQSVYLLVLGALDDAEHAPGHMVVDRSHLPRPP